MSGVGRCVISRPGTSVADTCSVAANPRAGSNRLTGSAPRVFWIVDNGSSHRGQASVHRLQDRWPNLILVHTPVHASWVNQIEIYFSIVQRKVLSPNDFQNLDEIADRLNRFERLYNQIAEPFGWNFSRDKLNAWLARLEQRENAQLALAA